MQHYLTTQQLADALCLKPESIRTHVCRNGSYYGIRPSKAPNRRLLWPADSVERILGKGGMQG